MLAHLHRGGCKRKQASKYTSACDVGEDLKKKNASKYASALGQEWGIIVISERVCVRLKCRGKCWESAGKYARTLTQGRMQNKAGE